MDGFKGQLSGSLQFKLSVWLALVIVGVAVVAGVFSFSAAFREANELQDDQLRQIATMLHSQHLTSIEPIGLENASETDPESLVVLQVLNEPGNRPPAAPANSILFPTDLKDGMQTVMVEGQSWRVVVSTLNQGLRIVIGQQTSVRDEIARDSAFHTLLPLVVLIPILISLVSELIRKTLKPVTNLANDIDQRTQEDIRELSEHRVPSEVRPFVTAINRLLSRVQQSMAGQRRFLADAAHELRTPLTALSLQAERLASADMSEEAKIRLAVMRGGLERSRLLLDQLLVLVRAQEVTTEPMTPISVRATCRQVMEDLIPLAQAKGIDLGMLGELDHTVCATEMDLFTLVKNLIDNAIRYTPRGGRVNLSVRQSQGKTILQIDDTGPGIAIEERNRVFDPFYRTLGNGEIGSGLGLSIVQTISLRLGAEIQLSYADIIGKTGLRVEVFFPSPNSH